MRPAGQGLEPDQVERDFTAELAAGEPVVVASGRAEHAGSTALDIANRFAALHLATPPAGRTITLPAAPFGHLYLVRGAVTVDGAGETAELAPGDALRTVDTGPLTVTASEDAELVFWEMHASFDV